ncbi:MAG: RluA family pseudouridine synthase [Clostridiales bacterium]|nr:RluA family pseudouridine synthase [Clostridiales bacterium]
MEEPKKEVSEIAGQARNDGRKQERIIIADKDAARLDAYLAEVTELSRSQAQRRIKEGRVLVNGAPCKVNLPVKQGDCIAVDSGQVTVDSVEPQDIPLDIVYEDDFLIVINKPQGLVVHPAAGNSDGTLVNALLFAGVGLSGLGGDLRPGIVHRIDKMTSGLLVVAKDDKTHLALAEQFGAHTASRSYLALVHGNIKTDSGTVDANVGRHPKHRKKMAVTAGGRHAVTHYTVLARFGVATLLRLELETGRTHQIRVHMAHLKHPVLGDEVYGTAAPKLGLTGQALHGFALQFVHPKTGERVSFTAPLPQTFLSALKKLGWDGTSPEGLEGVFCEKVD